MPTNDDLPSTDWSRRIPPSRVFGGLLLTAGATGICLGCAQGVPDATGNFLLGIASELAAFGILKAPDATRALTPNRYRPQRWRHEQAPADRFPLELFFQRLEKAQHVVIRETYTFLLTDPEYRERFTKALAAAANRGARIQILLLCPCSAAARSRAAEIGMAAGDFIKGIEHNLRELFLVRSALTSDIRKNLQVKLTPTAPQATGYRCDGMTLLSMLPLTRPSEESQYIDLPTESSFLTPWNETFQDLWHSGLPVDNHMWGNLIVHGDVDSKFHGVRFVQHQQQIYLAVDERDKVDALNRRLHVTWSHGIVSAAMYVPVPLRRASGEDGALLGVLDGHVEHKYGSAKRYFFFRLDPAVTESLVLLPIPAVTTRPTERFTVLTNRRGA